MWSVLSTSAVCNYCCMCLWIIKWCVYFHAVITVWIIIVLFWVPALCTVLFEDKFTVELIYKPIHKKGDKLECSNYRAITLLNITYKVLSGILYNWLAEYAEKILGDYQCGFWANRSTIDHIFTIRQTQEKAYEYNIHLHNLYIDFKQAFDSVSRGRILNDLTILGIPKKLVQLICVTMAGSRATVRVDNQYTPTFPIGYKSVLSDSALSAILFDLVLEAIFQ